MKQQLSGFFILSGLLAGIAAAIIAYFITYNNFLRHYSKSGLPGRIAVVTAIVVFVGFFGLNDGSRIFPYKIVESIKIVP